MTILPLTAPDVRRIQHIPPSHYDLIVEGPIATVARIWLDIDHGNPQWLVVKSASTQRKFCKEPHDILKELRLLTPLAHPNIIRVLGSFHDESNAILAIYIPYIPITLLSLLDSPFFSPHPFPPTRAPDPSAAARSAAHVALIVRSCVWQLLRGLAFLHAAPRRIAHRDIKPANVLLTPEGCLTLIDFGIAWSAAEPDIAQCSDMWPEYRGKHYFEVSTGPYRAPELLFGTRTYDPFAIDLWSLGATLAEFFTPLRLSIDDGDEDSSSDEDDSDNDRHADNETPRPASLPASTPFIIPRHLRIGYPGAHWMRASLFNGNRGDIGLAWSIFKIRGTPDASSWPEFCDLPSAQSVVFTVVPPIPLLPLLPNLPPPPTHEPLSWSPLKALPSASTHMLSSSSSISPCATAEQHHPSPSPGHSTSFPTPTESSLTTATDASTHVLPPNPSASHLYAPAPTPLTLLTRLLTYRPQDRVPAATALHDPWLLGTGTGIPLLLPQGYDMGQEEYNAHTQYVHEWAGETLGKLLKDVLKDVPES